MASNAQGRCYDGRPKGYAVTDRQLQHLVVHGTAQLGSVKSPCVVAGQVKAADINADNVVTNSLTTNNFQVGPNDPDGPPPPPGFKVATFNGDVNITGVLDPTGVQFTPVSSNPSASDPSATIYVDSANGHLVRGTRDLEAVFTDMENGLAPASGGAGTLAFLSAAKTWIPPVLPSFAAGVQIYDATTRVIKTFQSSNQSLTAADSTTTSLVIKVNDLNTYQTYAATAFPADNVSMMGQLLPGIAKWQGGCLAPNGKIYAAPNRSDEAFVIDPERNTTYTFGAGSFPVVAGNMYIGIVSSPGGLLFCIPSNAEEVAVIDTNTDTVTLSANSYVGPAKWELGVLAPTGKIYCAPLESQQILVIDTLKDPADPLFTYLIGPMFPGIQKWSGGALAPNGKIYMIPRRETRVLVIDTATESVNTFFPPSPLPPSTAGGRRWNNGAYSPVTNKIYGMYGTTNEILVIDPTTDSASYLGVLKPNSLIWVGGILAPTGFIYGTPSTGDDVLKVDPVNMTVTFLGASLPGLFKWASLVLARNGNMYGIPFNATDVLVVSSGPPQDFTSGIHHLGNVMQVPWPFVLSPYYDYA